MLLEPSWCSATATYQVCSLQITFARLLLRTFGILVSVLRVFQPPEAKIQVRWVLIWRDKKPPKTNRLGCTSHSLFCNRVAFPKTPMNLFPTLCGLNEQHNGCWGEIYEGSGGDAAQVGAYGECNQPGRPHAGCCSTCLCCPTATNVSD